MLNFGVARATTVVAGTFDRANGSALPVQLAGDPGIGEDLAWDPDRPGEGRPLMIADRATFGALVRKIHQQPLWTADLSLPATSTLSRPGRPSRPCSGSAGARSTTRPARRRDQHGQAPRDPAVDRDRPARHRHRCA